MKFRHLQTLSGRGEAPDQFQVRITALAVAADDRLFALGDRCVKSFSSAGELVGQFDTSDAGWSIAADGKTLWIGMQGGVVQVDFTGNVIAAIDDPGRLGRVTGVAVAGDRLLVADATHKSLSLYRDGKYVREVGAKANTRGFMIPNGVLSAAYDRQSDTFVVAHPQKHRIERYDRDGELVDKFGRFGHDDPAAFGGCCNPTTAGVTPAGIILATEKAPPHVKAFAADGKFLAMTPEDAFDPSAKNQAVAADKSGRVYATDSVRGTIEVFQLTDA